MAAGVFFWCFSFFSFLRPTSVPSSEKSRPFPSKSRQRRHRLLLNKTIFSQCDRAVLNTCKTDVCTLTHVSRPPHRKTLYTLCRSLCTTFLTFKLGGWRGEVFTESVTVHDYQHNPSITAKFCRDDDLEAGGSIKPVGPPVMADETLIWDV